MFSVGLEGFFERLKVGFKSFWQFLLPPVIAKKEPDLGEELNVDLEYAP